MLEKYTAVNITKTKREQRVKEEEQMRDGERKEYLLVCEDEYRTQNRSLIA